MSKHHRNERLIKAVGTRLRLIREDLKMTQEDVAFQKDIYLTNIENGYTNITIGKLVELCDLYKISMKEFIKGLSNYD